MEKRKQKEKMGPMLKQDLEKQEYKAAISKREENLKLYHTLKVDAEHKFLSWAREFSTEFVVLGT